MEEELAPAAAVDEQPTTLPSASAPLAIDSPPAPPVSSLNQLENEADAMDLPAGVAGPNRPPDEPAATIAPGREDPRLWTRAQLRRFLVEALVVLRGEACPDRTGTHSDETGTDSI